MDLPALQSQPAVLRLSLRRMSMSRSEESNVGRRSSIGLPASSFSRRPSITVHSSFEGLPRRLLLARQEQPPSARVEPVLEDDADSQELVWQSPIPPNATNVGVTTVTTDEFTAEATTATTNEQVDQRRTDEKVVPKRWNGRQNQLLRRWLERTTRLVSAHIAAAKLLRSRGRRLGIAGMVLGAFSTSGILSTLGADRIKNAYVVYAITLFVGLLTIGSTVLASLSAFLDFGPRGERHRIAAGRFSFLVRRIENIANADDDQRGDAVRVLQSISDEYYNIYQVKPTTDKPPARTHARTDTPKPRRKPAWFRNRSAFRCLLQLQRRRRRNTLVAQIQFWRGCAFRAAAVVGAMAGPRKWTEARTKKIPGTTTTSRLDDDRATRKKKPTTTSAPAGNGALRMMASGTATPSSARRSKTVTPYSIRRTFRVPCTSKSWCTAAAAEATKRETKKVRCIGVVCAKRTARLLPARRRAFRPTCARRGRDP